MSRAIDAPWETLLSDRERAGFDAVLRDALHAQTLIRCRSALIHDVKSASQAIYWAVDLLKKTVSSSTADPAVKDKQEKYLGWCRQELDNLQKTTQKVLADVTQADLIAGPVDIGALLLELGKLAGDEAALLDVDLQLDVAQNVLANSSRAQLRQALLGLLFNALDAMTGGGKLRIELQPGTDTHRITIRDSRTISSPPDRDWFAVDLASEPLSDGIAFHVARSIVLAHRGAIHVEYAADAGLIVRIDLPQAPAVSAA